MNPLVNLAKLTIETYIKEGKIIEPSADLPNEFLNKKAGVFVTIEKSGAARKGRASPDEVGRELRACIGTYLPTRMNIAEEIIHNAVAAATEDYRFGSVQKEELPYLSYTVYILGGPETVNSVEELNPKKYGIIVKTFSPAYKSGLLLPDLEGIDTTEQQISIACQKGGIDQEKEEIIIYKFTAEKYF